MLHLIVMLIKRLTSWATLFW